MKEEGKKVKNQDRSWRDGNNIKDETASYEKIAPGKYGRMVTKIKTNRLPRGQTACSIPYIEIGN